MTWPTFLTSPAFVAAACVVVVLFLGGLATRLDAWYEGLRKPSWQPPGWLFAPAWTTIGVLTAWAAVLGWGATQNRPLLAVLFAVNGVLNVLWSVLFFRFQRPDWALAEVVPLWLSVFALILALAPASSFAAWLLAPYLVWVAFAAVLNLAVVRLNRPFPGVRPEATPR